MNICWTTTERDLEVDGDKREKTVPEVLLLCGMGRPV